MRHLLLSLLLLVGVAVHATTPVYVNSKGMVLSAATDYVTNYTTGSAANTALFYGEDNTGGYTVSSVQFGGSSFTLVTQYPLVSSIYYGSMLWVLDPAPLSTTGNITVTASGAASSGAFVLEYSNVDPIQPIVSFQWVSTPGGGNNSASVTTLYSGSYLLDMFSAGSGGQTTPTGYTQRVSAGGNTFAGDIPTTTPGPYTAIWSVSGTTYGAQILAEMKGYNASVTGGPLWITAPLYRVH